jgi:dTDP-4-dehydrorhamnose 3,5-epimerase
MRHMRFTETGISGAMLIEPMQLRDERGRFMRAWCYREFAERGIPFLPVQANLGFSLKMGTVRGMHYQQAPASESKLVRCTKGSIFDVVLDLRPRSPTYGQWYGAELNADNARMMYLPMGCAHGYQTLKPRTEIYYMASTYYAPSAVRGRRFDDPAFNIRWPLPPTMVSEQDCNWPLMDPPQGERVNAEGTLTI